MLIFRVHVVVTSARQRMWLLNCSLGTFFEREQLFRHSASCSLSFGHRCIAFCLLAVLVWILQTQSVVVVVVGFAAVVSELVSVCLLACTRPVRIHTHHHTISLIHSHTHWRIDRCVNMFVIDPREPKIPKEENQVNRYRLLCVYLRFSSSFFLFFFSCLISELGMGKVGNDWLILLPTAIFFSSLFADTIYV